MMLDKLIPVCPRQNAMRARILDPGGRADAFRTIASSALDGTEPQQYGYRCRLEIVILIELHPAEIDRCWWMMSRSSEGTW